MSKVLVACYCRVSTKKEEQELSLENQAKFFAEYTEQNNMKIYKIYTDDGISAKSMTKRDGFNKMVSDAKKGLVQKILVKDISRFARNTLDFLGVIRSLKTAGIEVQFITANMTTLDSEFTLTILAAMAQEESANLSKRVKFSKQLSAKEGRVPSLVYGYDKVPKDRYGLTINETEAKVILRVFQLYVQEQRSSYQIARLLNEEGVPTKKGGKYKWSQTVICGILRNRLYIGEVCNGKSEVKDFITDTRVKYGEDSWIITQRPEFQIVPTELFERANQIRKSRSNSFHQFEDDGKTIRRCPSIKHPLSNLLVCANDNYSFRRRVRAYAPSGLVYTYWTCSKRDYGGSVCDNTVKVDEKMMQKAIAEFLISLFQNREAIYKRFQEKVSRELSARYENEYNIDSLRSEEKKLLSDRDKLMDLYLAEKLDQTALQERVIGIEKRLKEVETLIGVYDQCDKTSIDIEKCLVKLTERIDENLGDMMNNAFLKSIFDRFLVYPDGRVEAVIRLDMDTGESLTIPFGEFVDEKEIPLPKCAPDI